MLAGYHHQWGPGSHTLFLAGRLQDTLSLTNPAHQTILTLPGGSRWLSRYVPARSSVPRALVESRQNDNEYRICEAIKIASTEVFCSGASLCQLSVINPPVAVWLAATKSSPFWIANAH